jgi:hypothetical protein
MNWSMAYWYTRREAGEPRLLEHGQFAMVQIRQAQYPATVIRLNSMLAHGDGLPCRSIGTTADRPEHARGFERFYEKVIKVKADVAALLSLFSDVSIDVRS